MTEPTLEIIDGPFTVANGMVCVVRAPYEMSRQAPALIGQVVVLAGERREVLGVNSRAPAFPIREGEEISVLFGPAIDSHAGADFQIY